MEVVIYKNIWQISMLAKLLAAVLQPPRFVGARRKQSDKTGNKRNKAVKYTRILHNRGRGSLACSHRERSVHESAVLTPLSAVIVVIVPADLHLNKAWTVFARNLFCRETGTCVDPTLVIGQMAAHYAVLDWRSPIGANFCLSVCRMQILRFEGAFKF